MARAVVFSGVNTLAYVEYPARDCIVTPKGDDTTVVFSVYDKDGDEFDIIDSTEVNFFVQEGRLVGGNMFSGGETLFYKNLSNGIAKLPTGYQVAVTISGSDTDDLVHTHMYYEINATINGQRKTIGAGLFLTPNTVF